MAVSALTSSFTNMRHNVSRLLFLSILVLFFIATVSHASPILNIRDAVECVPAGAFDIVTFFLVNFGTHVMSIKSFPGTNRSTMIKWALAAFLCPYSGIVRGCVAIARGFIWGETELQRAARAGALAYVVRDKRWRPREGETIRDVGFWSETSGRVTRGNWYIRHEDTHGTDRLYPGQHLFHGQVDGNLEALGYSLRRVQAMHDVLPLKKRSELHLGNEASWLKALAAIIQLASACYTLYQSRGAQVERYGYAAFGLCVIPYAVMSLVNFVAAAVNADYPAIYLVKTDIMDEAMSRGAEFSGMVGRIGRAASRSQRYQTIHGSPSVPPDHEYHRYLKDVKVVKSGASFVVDQVVKHDESEIEFDWVALEPNVRRDAWQHPHPHPHQPQQHDIWPLLSADAAHDGTFSRLLPDHDGFTLEDAVALEIPSDGHLARRGDMPLPSRHASGLVRCLADMRPRHWIALVVGVVALLVPYALIAWLTAGFRQGTGSTVAERAWTMAWLVSGTVLGFLLGVCLHYTPDNRWALYRRSVPMFVLVCAPAIGGCAIVAKEILEFGTCTAIG